MKMKIQIITVRTIKPRVKYIHKLLEIFIFGSSTLPSMNALSLAPLFKPTKIRLDLKSREV